MNIEALFAILKDGTWHDILEVASRVKAQPEKLVELAEYLLEKRIIKYETETRKMQIEPEWNQLIPDENELQPQTHRHLKS